MVRIYANIGGILMVNNIAYMDPMGVETKILRCFCWNPDPELRSSNLRQSEGTVQATSWEKEQNTIYYSLLFYHLVIKPDVLKKPQFSSVIFPTTNLHLARGLYIEFQPPPAPPPLSLRPRPGTQIYPNHVSSEVSKIGNPVGQSVSSRITVITLWWTSIAMENPL